MVDDKGSKTECGLKAYRTSRKVMTSFKLDQFVEEEICDKYVVELSLGDLPKVSCSSRRKPRPINDNLRYCLLENRYTHFHMKTILAETFNNL